MNFDEKRWKLFLQASRTILNRPGFKKPSGSPNCSEAISKKSYFFTTICCRAYVSFFEPCVLPMFCLLVGGFSYNPKDLFKKFVLKIKTKALRSKFNTR